MDSDSPLPAILFVDDSDDDFFLIQRLLKKAGVKNPVIRFGNGSDAMRFLLDKSIRPGPTPCLMFLDVRMPGISGFQLLAWIKHHPTYQHAKVFMLSGGGVEGDVKRAAHLGADGFLVKFPAFETFQKLISDVCTRAAA